MKTTLLHLLAALACIIAASSYLQAQNFHIVKDINTATNSYPFGGHYAGNNGIYTNVYTILNGISYFTAEDGLHGYELWRSDGTEAGTCMIKDILEGATGSFPNDILVFKNALYFIAFDSLSNTELWKSDGTTNGTIKVKSFNSVGQASIFTMITTTQNLVFSLYDNGQVQLWKSDGTELGTQIIKDFTGTDIFGIWELLNVGDNICFFAEGSFEEELWKTNATSEGTVKLLSLPNGVMMTALVSNGKTLFFGDSNDNLWKSNATSAGTVVVENTKEPMFDFVAFGSRLVFTTAGGNKNTLWQSDGTASGTQAFYKTKDTLTNKTVVNNKIFFLSASNPGSHELWKTDGTQKGTVLLKGFDSGYFPESNNLMAVNDELYFAGYTSATGYEIWKSDGTSTGTFQVKDLFAGASSSYPFSFTALNNKVLFGADDGNSGVELWILDSATGITSMVKDINTYSNASSQPFSLTPFNGKLYFGATDDKFGTEIWKSDGTETGTALVKDTRTGSLNGLYNIFSNTPFPISGNNFYFKSFTDRTGYELWASNGTSSGTHMVKDIAQGISGSGSSLPNPYGKQTADLNGRFFFVTDNQNGNAIDGSLLYSTKGDNTDTYLINSDSTSLDNLTPCNNKLFYTSYRHAQLWVTDSTAETNKIIQSAHIDNRNSLFSYHNILYFGSEDGNLWRTDGTEAHTKLFKKITPYPFYFSAYPDVFDWYNDHLVNANIILNDTLYFVASEALHGSELWKTDGTLQGTTLVKDINKGAGDSQAGSFVGVDNIFYFLANDGVHGRELWKTDGTGKGTKMVKDITAGSASSEIVSLTRLENEVIFLVYTGNTSFKLWRSNGTAKGTVEVDDVSLTNVNIIPSLQVINDRIFFTGSTTQQGSELWTGTLTGMDTKATFSNPASLQVNNNKNVNIIVQPNPFMSNFSLQINNIDNDHQIQLQILNMNGAIILSEKRNLNSGSNLLNYNASWWTAGVYIVRIMLANGFTKEIKIVKQ